ncbi:MAG: WYL domain-containing transcriptional regulator [Rhodocyclaceae bacterium]|nr:WYL domain-containing transcriptional regulator [Rhodocyclaceae bacterium]
MLHRFFRLHDLLRARHLPLPREEIATQLECNRSSVTRLIRSLREYGAQIECVRGQGYRYTKGADFALPGLWFTPSELTALLLAQRLLEDAEPGLLSAALAPVRKRIKELVSAEHLGSGELSRRMHLPRAAGRGVGCCFETCALALAQRRRLEIEYQPRSDARPPAWRSVSPQRLTRWRDNWYLEAWCHERGALRSFALERILRAQPLDQAAHEVALADVAAHFDAAYGIFAGPPRERARLLFSAERARWVAEEQWHPDQYGRSLPDGRYELELPYADARELAMDILRHGRHVEVLAPDSLRAAVRAELQAALAQYFSPPGADVLTD